MHEQKLNALKNPNSRFCVGIVEAWEEQGYLYICSELCERGNLNDYILHLTGRSGKSRQSQPSSCLMPKEVMYCTEESQEEGKDEDVGEPAPVNNFFCSGGFEVASGEDTEMAQLEERSDSLIFASSENQPK